MSGPDRARLWTELPVYHALAVYHASAGRSIAAWEAIEAGLSPGFTDDVGLADRAWTEGERRKESELREAYVAASRRLS